MVHDVYLWENDPKPRGNSREREQTDAPQEHSYLTPTPPKIVKRPKTSRFRHLLVSLGRAEPGVTERVSRNAPHPLRWRFSHV